MMLRNRHFGFAVQQAGEVLGGICHKGLSHVRLDISSHDQTHCLTLGCLLQGIETWVNAGGRVLLNRGFESLPIRNSIAYPGTPTRIAFSRGSKRCTSLTLKS
jgi:hypothetical protein